MCTSVTSPIRANASRTVSLVDENDRLPTYRRVPMCLSSLTNDLPRQSAQSSDRPQNQKPGRGGEIRSVPTLVAVDSARDPESRETRRCRGNVRDLIQT